ncbi:MAG: hypothetical protein JST19_03525 [Bacteroidetes bacterium]|nr:hypothetical protein [Bacteroidota bacterium]
MKVLRWIFGFPLATSIVLAIFYFGVTYADVFKIYQSSYVSYFIAWSVRMAITGFCFASWVFLTCLFIPKYKKIAGVLPMTVTIALMIYIIYNAYKAHELLMSQRTYLLFGCMLISELTGYFVSYIIFRKKGWGRRKKSPEFMLFEGEPFNNSVL